VELVVKVITGEALAAAVELGVGAVAVPLPLTADASWWGTAASWLAHARSRGVKFYLVWERLVRQDKRGQTAEILGAIARVEPDALVLRDLGVAREARRLYPGLTLHGAGGLGLHNSPGLGLGKAMGFSRVVLAVPVALKDLALMRRETDLALEVAVPPGGRFPGLCFLEDFPDEAGLSGAFPEAGKGDSGWLAEALEMLPALAQLGVEAVQVGPEFSQAGLLKLVVPLFQAVLEATPVERPRVLAAAREVWAALGEGRETAAPRSEAVSTGKSFRASKGKEAAAPRLLAEALKKRGRVWLEARGYGEAAALAREWRGPLVVPLTPEDYRAFLPEHRRWEPRRLVWRLPALVREAGLTFYLQALKTLTQGGYRRFAAGDWGGVALARAAGGEVFGDQTLGLLNSWALNAARELGVARFCLPPGARLQEALELINLSQPESFWGYLYHFPALAVCPREGEAALPPRPPAGSGLRWAREGDLAVLCPEAAVPLTEVRLQQMVAPLVISLPRSGLPWGKVPPWAVPGRAERSRA